MINDVVLDPMLAKRMREHQKEGVKVSALTVRS